MKKLYTLLVITLIGYVGNAQIVNIPDANFKAALLVASSNNTIASSQPLVYDSSTGIYSVSSYNKIDANNDGQIQVVEAQAITYLNLYSFVNFSSLVGIESFVNLQYLDCSDVFNSSISNLDLSQNTSLQLLNCSYNNLANLNISGSLGLKVLTFENNHISSLNVSQFTELRELYCSSNYLTSLDISQNTALTKIFCGDNLFNSINVTQNIALRALDCSALSLVSLNVSQNPLLRYLSCFSNDLTSLNLSQNPLLEHLAFSNNELTSIDLSGLTNLRYLGCNNNQLTNLNVSGLTNLQNLQCHYNQLTSLDVSGSTNLQSLNCSYNQLASLFLKNGRGQSILLDNNPLQYVCVDEAELTYIQSMIPYYSINTCSVNSYCSFTPGGVYYSIQGNNRIDSNSNGCDANDSNYPSLKCAITNGTVTGTFISNTAGTYNFPVQAGNHTVTPIIENPSYFTVSPASVSVSFPTTASPFIQNFCIAPNGVHHDLEVTIIPIEVARPGFDAFYKIIYKNKGNQVENGSLSLTFNDAIMDLVTASPIVNTTGTNSLSWNYANLNPFETREINLTFNINSPMETPAVNIGDQLDFTAIINPLANDEIVADNTSSLKQIVVGSYDPNDKTCLEGITITPSMVGNYVHYVIRFENTGTFAAQNVVIKDMIDTTKFDIASLIPQSSSHPFVTRITNTNQVEFIFENINLPFNDATNDGYVAFKIKTKPTLVLGNTFTNTARIYFDYNFPIVTNTTTTTVATLGNQDFDFGSVFALSPVPAKDFLTITTKQAVAVSSVNIYNTLGQLVQVITNPTETIDVSGLQSGSYFVRITSDKGSATGKFLKE